jgi:hypothetical protein
MSSVSSAMVPRRQFALPVATTAVGAAAVMWVGLVNPAAPGGGLLPCPFHRVTGLWCPGCGLTRGTHQLLTGHPMRALGYNVFTPVVLALLVWAWAAWAIPAITGRRLVPEPHAVVSVRWWYALGGLALAYGIARNLPVHALAALAP